MVKKYTQYKRLSRSLTRERIVYTLQIHSNYVHLFSHSRSTRGVSAHRVVHVVDDYAAALFHSDRFCVRIGT